MPPGPGCGLAESTTNSIRPRSPRSQCSAVEDYARRGACPPLGRRRDVAESAAPTRRTKSQLRLFILWCAGASRDDRLVRKYPYAASIVPRNPTNLPDRHWYENDVTRLPSAPANPYIRHSREGGNPRTNIPQKNVNRDTTTYVHAATPLRLSGKTMSRTPIRGWNPEGRGWEM